MAVLDIIKYGHPLLRIKSKPINDIDDSIQTLADDLIETMHEEEGIGLAATQVAQSLALCVVNLGLIEEYAAPKVYINPEILQEDGFSTMEEGCLSIPDIRDEVTRPDSIRIKYKDLDGLEHEEKCNGLLSRVLQHEIDHLNGVLFVDRISQIKRKLLSKKLKRIAAGIDLELPVLSDSARAL